MRNEIGQRFRRNLERVRNIVVFYKTMTAPGPGRPSIRLTCCGPRSSSCTRHHPSTPLREGFQNRRVARLDAVVRTPHSTRSPPGPQGMEAQAATAGTAGTRSGESSRLGDGARRRSMRSRANSQRRAVAAG